MHKALSVFWLALASVGLLPPPAPTLEGGGEVEFLGEVSFPPGAHLEGIPVGGLSALAYDPEAEHYLVLSDNRGDDPEKGVPRFYTLRLSWATAARQPQGIEVLRATELHPSRGVLEPFPPGYLDPEGFALSPDGKGFWLATEGDAEQGIPPALMRFSSDGIQQATLPLPRRYLPNRGGSRGVRNNNAFESATLSPDGRFLYTATESGLVQDGSESDVQQGGPTRILRFDLERERLDAEYLYLLDPVPFPPLEEGGTASNGLVELLALPRMSGRLCPQPLLALERSYSAGHPPGQANSVRLYRTCPGPLHEVTGRRRLPPRWRERIPPVTKELLLDFTTLGIHIDNIEGMTLGPILPDGRRSLILVSDDNFRDSQRSQFLVLALPRGE